MNNEVDFYLDKLKEAVDAKDERLYEAMDAAVAIAWISREFVNEYAADHIKAYFAKAVEKLMPVADEVLLVNKDSGEFMLPSCDLDEAPAIVEDWLEETYGPTD